MALGAAGLLGQLGILKIPAAALNTVLVVHALPVNVLPGFVVTGVIINPLAPSQPVGQTLILVKEPMGLLLLAG